MIIRDLQQERETSTNRELERLAQVYNLARDFFGAERVSTYEILRIVGSNHTKVFIDVKNIFPFTDASIDVTVLGSGIEIVVRNEDLYSQAVEFGRRYEKKYEGESVELRHNLL